MKMYPKNEYTHKESPRTNTFFQAFKKKITPIFINFSKSDFPTYTLNLEGR